MIPRPQEVNALDSYLTASVNTMVIKGGEVYGLMTGLNSIFDPPFVRGPDPSIRAETTLTEQKFPQVIVPMLELSRANKAQLPALDDQLEDAPIDTNPNNLIENVVNTHNNIRQSVDNLLNAIEEVKKTLGKCSAYTLSSLSPSTNAVASAQSASEGEGFAAVQSYNATDTISSLRGEASYKMNNLKGAVDTTVAQLNNFRANIGSTYSGSLTKPA